MIERDALTGPNRKEARFARLETKAVQRSNSGPWPVSAVRMVPLGTFETTLKFGVVGVADGVCDGEMADGAGFEPAIRFPVYTLSKRAP